jgi:hypothetical protein
MDSPGKKKIGQQQQQQGKANESFHPDDPFDSIRRFRLSIDLFMIFVDLQ